MKPQKSGETETLPFRPTILILSLSIPVLVPIPSPPPIHCSHMAFPLQDRAWAVAWGPSQVRVARAQAAGGGRDHCWPPLWAPNRGPLRGSLIPPTFPSACLSPILAAHCRQNRSTLTWLQTRWAQCPSRDPQVLLQAVIRTGGQSTRGGKPEDTARGWRPGGT